MEWIIYNVRTDLTSRDPRRPKEIPKEFSIVFKKPDRMVDGCSHPEYVEIRYWNYGEKSKVVDVWETGCPRHEGREITIPNNELMELAEKGIQYIKGELTDKLRPKNIKIIGINKEYYGNMHTDPRYYCFRVKREITNAESESVPDETIWCGFCIEESNTCEWYNSSKGIPRCLSDRDF